MLLKLLLMILGGCLVPTGASAQADPAPIEEPEVPTSPHFQDILELGKANPDFVENYCERILNGTASFDPLSKALPVIMQTVTSDDYVDTDRMRVRDALRKVYLRINGTLDKTVREDFYQIIIQITTA